MSALHNSSRGTKRPKRAPTRHATVYAFTVYMYDIPQGRTGRQFFGGRFEPQQIEVKCVGTESDQKYYAELVQVGKGLNRLEGSEQLRFIQAVRLALKQQSSKKVYGLTPDLIDYGESKR